MLKEFQKFLLRENVIDLAVAVVIGVAFTAIVDSLVNDIIMPVIGVIIGGIDFSGLSITIGSAVIAYGRFLQAIVNFLLIGTVIFLVVKAINTLQDKLSKKEEEAPAVPPEEVTLLREIRDLLKTDR